MPYFLSLNFNLILLIHYEMIRNAFECSTLNSNLILLIPRHAVMFGLAGLHFKFQSDSINTEDRLNQDFKRTPLNSNLILLIHLFLAALFQPLFDFKFQSDSINTEIDSKEPRIIQL